MIPMMPDDGSEYYYADPSANIALLGMAATALAKAELREKWMERMEEGAQERRDLRSQALMKIIEIGKHGYQEDARQAEIIARERRILIQQIHELDLKVIAEKELTTRHLRASAVFERLTQMLAQRVGMSEDDLKAKRHELFDQIDGRDGAAPSPELAMRIAKHRQDAEQFRSCRRRRQIE